jgi:hypothetical protein
MDRMALAVAALVAAVLATALVLRTDSPERQILVVAVVATGRPSTVVQAAQVS